MGNSNFRIFGHQFASLTDMGEPSRCRLRLSPSSAHYTMRPLLGGRPRPAGRALPPAHANRAGLPDRLRAPRRTAPAAETLRGRSRTAALCGRTIRTPSGSGRALRGAAADRLPPCRPCCEPPRRPPFTGDEVFQLIGVDRNLKVSHRSGLLWVNLLGTNSNIADGGGFFRLAHFTAG